MGEIYMIKEIAKEDYHTILENIEDDIFGIEKEEIIQSLNNSINLITFDRSEIGFAAIWSDGNTLGVENYQVLVYVNPDFRLKGYGSILLNEITSRITHEGPKEFRVENMLKYCDISAFLKKNGYEIWYSSSLMVFNGGRFDSTKIDLVPYEDKFFNQYLELLNEAFYPLQVENDIKPYIIQETQEFREYLSNASDEFRLSVEGSKLIGVVQVTNDHVSRAMVLKEARGKGLGSELIKYATNRILDSGYSIPKLYIIDTNNGARRLYESIGYSVDSTVHVYRKYSKS